MVGKIEENNQIKMKRKLALIEKLNIFYRSYHFKYNNNHQSRILTTSEEQYLISFEIRGISSEENHVAIWLSTRIRSMDFYFQQVGRMV